MTLPVTKNGPFSVALIVVCSAIYPPGIIVYHPCLPPSLDRVNGLSDTRPGVLGQSKKGRTSEGYPSRYPTHVAERRGGYSCKGYSIGKERDKRIILRGQGTLSASRP